MSILSRQQNLNPFALQGAFTLRAGLNVRLLVTHGLKQYDVTVSPQITIGDLKKVLAQESGLDPTKQKMLFRGKETEDGETLDTAGIKDMARLILQDARRVKAEVDKLTADKLKETVKSLGAEEKRRKEREDGLTCYRTILHDLKNKQQEMLNEIEGSKMKKVELQNEKDRTRRDLEKEREERKKLEQVSKAERSKFEKQEKHYQTKIDELEHQLVDAHTQLKEIKESQEKRMKETEDELARNKKDLHYFQKTQEEMLNEIEKLMRKIPKLQNEKDKIEGFDFSSNNLEVNYINFTNEEIKAATDNFKDTYKIGEGGYGVVYKAFLGSTLVAIKVVKSESFRWEREFNQEVKILSRVRHPNLVRLLGACPEARTLIYEFMPNGCLYDILNNKCQYITLNWKMRIRIASNICAALIYLHSAKPHGIVHGDLKSSNILLDLNYTAKISDFGLCRHLYQTETRITPHHYTLYPKGTLAYMDPEYLNTGDLTSQYDVYSFGIVLLELVTGRVAMGLRKLVADALIKAEQFVDDSAGWPFKEAKRLAQLGIRCSDTRMNRPDLMKEVWGEIKSMERACGN